MDIDPKMLDLARAFNEARLAALHIDMQLKFFEEFCRESRVPTKHIFPKVNKFSQDLRNLKVPNHWVAYTGHWNKISYGDFKTGKMPNNRPYLARDLSFLPSMDIRDDEMVFEKAKQWGFRNINCPMHDYLVANNQDTIIIDGVKDKHCIAGTIETGLKRGFRIYAAMDATNCPPDQIDDYMEWFLRPEDLTPVQKSRITFTTTDTVLETLTWAQANPQAFQSLAHG